MATVADLISKNGVKEATDGIGAISWYAVVSRPLPATTSDDLYVLIPDVSEQNAFGPCRWKAASVPSEGDECLVVFDNRMTPHVIALY